MHTPTAARDRARSSAVRVRLDDTVAARRSVVQDMIREMMDPARPMALRLLRSSVMGKPNMGIDPLALLPTGLAICTSQT